MDSIRRHQTVVMVEEELGVMEVAEMGVLETVMEMAMAMEHSKVLMVVAEVEVEFQYLH